MAIRCSLVSSSEAHQRHIRFLPDSVGSFLLWLELGPLFSYKSVASFFKKQGAGSRKPEVRVPDLLIVVDRLGLFSVRRLPRCHGNSVFTCSESLTHQCHIRFLPHSVGSFLLWLELHPLFSYKSVASFFKKASVFGSQPPAFRL